MKIEFFDKKIDYTGKELAPHYIFNNFNIVGNAIVSFVGSAEVPLANMVDLEDVNKKEHIYSPKMLHFLGEFFDISLRETVYIQRLLVSITKDIIDEDYGVYLKRSGDDLYFENSKKLSVSIATKSITSTLIHFGINIETQGTPVETSGLRDLGIDYKELSKKVLNKIKGEMEDIFKSICKVKGLGYESCKNI